MIFTKGRVARVKLRILSTCTCALRVFRIFSFLLCLSWSLVFTSIQLHTNLAGRYAMPTPCLSWLYPHSQGLRIWLLMLPQIFIFLCTLLLVDFLHCPTFTYGLRTFQKICQIVHVTGKVMYIFSGVFRGFQYLFFSGSKSVSEVS